ncbi:MAG TPA: DUF420 domain-containing protein [Terriglobia bacterium]|nr:DUF420 domain-containing protein [Terriglobia bacterium]
MSRGFLRTAAPLRTDLVLTAELLMGAALLVGMFLARRGKYRAHAWCQSAVMLLNLVLIAFIMAPSFSHQVVSEIPASLGDSYYALAVAHGALGTVAEMFGLYILLVAGTNILPKQIRFTRYKPWMRTALVLWWAVLLLGIGTYVRWYVVSLWER